MLSEYFISTMHRYVMNDDDDGHWKVSEREYLNVYMWDKDLVSEREREKNNFNRLEER